MPEIVGPQPEDQPHCSSWRKHFGRKAAKLSKHFQKFFTVPFCRKKPCIVPFANNRQPLGAQRVAPTFVSVAIQTDLLVVDQLRHEGETMTHRFSSSRWRHSSVPSTNTPLKGKIHSRLAFFMNPRLHIAILPHLPFISAASTSFTSSPAGDTPSTPSHLPNKMTVPTLHSKASPPSNDLLPHRGEHMHAFTHSFVCSTYTYVYIATTKYECMM